MSSDPYFSGGPNCAFTSIACRERAAGAASSEDVANDNTSPELAEMAVRRPLGARVAIISLATSGKLLAD
jgi:hypothetical protein